MQQIFGGYGGKLPCILSAIVVWGRMTNKINLWEEACYSNCIKLYFRIIRGIFGSSLGRKEGYIARSDVNKIQPITRKMYVLHGILRIYNDCLHKYSLQWRKCVFFFNPRNKTKKYTQVKYVYRIWFTHIVHTCICWLYNVNWNIPLIHGYETYYV